jgi:hypothetical protein
LDPGSEADAGVSLRDVQIAARHGGKLNGARWPGRLVCRPYGPGSANLNLVLRQGPSDPIGGNSPLRSSVCEVAPLPVDERMPS